MMQPKLVRDLYRDRIPSEALSVAEDGELNALLEAKLDEEVAELRSSAFSDPGEFADVIETLMELARRHGVAWDTVERTRIEKFKNRGGFKRGLVYNPALDPTRR